jgi:hypothetical protein
VSSLTNPEYNITTETPHANSVYAYNTSDSSDHIALLQLVGHPKGTIVFHALDNEKKANNEAI